MHLMLSNVTPVILCCFWRKCVLCNAQKLLFHCFRSKFGHRLRLNFLNENSNLAIGRFYTLSLTFGHLTLNVCCTSDVMQSKYVPNLSEIRG